MSSLERGSLIPTIERFANFQAQGGGGAASTEKTKEEKLPPPFVVKPTGVDTENHNLKPDGKNRSRNHSQQNAGQMSFDDLPK